MTRRPLVVGDRVRYTSEWLRSAGAYTGALPFARGTVDGVTFLPGGSRLVTVEWGPGGEDIPPRVLADNLERVC